MPDLKSLISKSIFKLVCKYIYNILSLNKLQCLIVEGILDHVIENEGKMQVVVKDQLLLYIRGENNIGKSQIIQALKMRFTFLNKQKELVISISTSCIANSIRGNIIHIALEINTKVRKNFVVKTNML